jgi:hypothetical protein
MNQQIQSILFMLLSKNDVNYFLIYFVMFIFFLNESINFSFLEKYYIHYLSNEYNYVSLTVVSHVVSIIRPFTITNASKVLYSDDFLAVIYYLNKHKKHLFNNFYEILSSNGELNVSKSSDNDNNKNIFTSIPYSENKVLIDINNSIYIEIKYEVITEPKDQDNNDKNNKNINKKKLFYLKLFIKKNNKNNEYLLLDNFINNCKKEYMINMEDDLTKQYIFEYVGAEKEDMHLSLIFNKYVMEHNKDLKKNIFFEKKDKMLNYIKPFIYDPTVEESDGEKQYKRSGFTFKAGILFYGSPGCGKSSTIKGILKETNRHAIIINLNKVKTNEELEKIFRNRTINNKKYIGKQLCYILEDCDAFENNILCSRDKLANVKKPDNQNSDLKDLANLIAANQNSNNKNIICSNNLSDDSVNLSCFLNILDGIIELHGIMIIMTTNHPEKIDEALIRPGRFDFKYEFKKATVSVLKDMLQFKFNISSIEIEKYTELNNLKDNVLSPAEIQSICFKNDNIIDCINDIIQSYQKQ